MTAIELTGDDEAKVEEFAGNLFVACLAAMELANVELGVRLGLYETLAGAGPLRAADLAAGAGIAERYAQEWLGPPNRAGGVGGGGADQAPPRGPVPPPEPHRP